MSVVGRGVLVRATRPLISLAEIVNRPANWPWGAAQIPAGQGIPNGARPAEVVTHRRPFGASTAPLKSDTACGPRA